MAKDISPENLKKVVLLQRFARRHLDRKKVTVITDQATQFKNALLKKDPSCEDISQLARHQSRAIGRTFYDVWIEIISYAPHMGTLAAISSTCQMLREIAKINLMWMPVCEFHFPLVVERKRNELCEVMLMTDTDDASEDKKEARSEADINWTALLQEMRLRQLAFEQVVRTMQDKKNRGNELYRGMDMEAASAMYNAGIKFASESQNSLKCYSEVLNDDLKRPYLHVSVLLHANAAQADLKLENFERALMHGVVAQKTLKEVKKGYADPARFKADYERLAEKISFRIEMALENLGPMARFVNYSPDPVEGLRQGTMLTHAHRAFTGFFDDTRVLMTELTERSVVGIISNKTWTSPSGRTMLVGGPCELEQVTTLHDIAEAPGARRIIQGVYEGGDVAQWRDSSEHTIRDYHGYSSWFPGQLQGEILNSNGWETTNEVSAQEVLQPPELFQFEAEELAGRGLD